MSGCGHWTTAQFTGKDEDAKAGEDAGASILALLHQGLLSAGHEAGEPSGPTPWRSVVVREEGVEFSVTLFPTNGGIRWLLHVGCLRHRASFLWLNFKDAFRRERCVLRIAKALDAALRQGGFTDIRWTHINGRVPSQDHPG